MKQHILIVDAYNMIGSWEKLKPLKQQNRLQEARDELLFELSNYQKIIQSQVIVVFDAMYVPGSQKHYRQKNLTIIWTKENETADSQIEKLAYQLNTPNNLVTVATSDQAEQWTIFAQGALRLPNWELEHRINVSKKEVKKTTKHYYNKAATRKPSLNERQLDQLAQLRDKLSHDSSVWPVA